MIFAGSAVITAFEVFDIIICLRPRNYVLILAKFLQVTSLWVKAAWKQSCSVSTEETKLQSKQVRFWPPPSILVVPACNIIFSSIFYVFWYISVSQRCWLLQNYSCYLLIPLFDLEQITFTPSMKIFLFLGMTARIIDYVLKYLLSVRACYSWGPSWRQAGE